MNKPITLRMKLVELDGRDSAERVWATFYTEQHESLRFVVPLSWAQNSELHGWYDVIVGLTEGKYDA